MDPKQALVAHGEKAVVLIVAAFSAWVVISAFTDESIRPKGITSQSIDDHINAIDTRMQSKDVPALKPAPPYLESMKTRFAKEVPSPQRISWLMNHPDIGGIGRGIYFYIYELHQPTVEAKDNIGTLEITVQPPRVSGNGDRVSSEWDKLWQRTTERAITNSAHVVGLQMQIQIGQSQWRPFKGKDVQDNGFIPMDLMKRTGGKFVMPTEAVWQKHTFRVRTILKATGFQYAGDKDKAKNQDETVLVWDPQAHDGAAFDVPKDWGAFSDGFENGDADAFMHDFLKGDKGPMPGVNLAKNEELYFTDWTALPEGAVSSVNATADIRFAFEKVATDPTDPSKEVATFLLSKQFRGKGGAANAWLDKPESFKVAKGDVLGGPRDLIPPIPPGGKLKSSVDLTTPFVLDDIKHDVDRVWYYELKVVPRTPPTKDKDLQIVPVVKKTDIAVLKNTKTGTTIELVKLADVRRPTRDDVIYYPTYPVAVYEEDKEFLKSPAEFQQWGLKPAEPVAHHPGEGPLEELRQKNDGNSLYSTDTDYYEFPDGRLFWWEIKNRILMQDPPKKEEDKPKTLPKSAPDPKAGPKTPTPPPAKPPEPKKGPAPQRPPAGTPTGPSGPPGGQQGGPPAGAPSGAGYPGGGGPTQPPPIPGH
jgi:hypothetical protein